MAHPMAATIDQIGYLVGNLDDAVRHWSETIGLGPWTVFRNSALVGTYRGIAAELTMDVALAYQGQVQIELIQLRRGTDNPYVDAGGKALNGIHHVAWVVDDLDQAEAAANARGLTTLFAAGNDAVRVVYLEYPDQPGVLYELIEGAQMRAMIADGIAATQGWDGNNPVTEIDLGNAAMTGGQ